MHCAAFPIRGIHGNLAGVLDMSSEGFAFNFDAVSVVGESPAAVNCQFFEDAHEVVFYSARCHSHFLGNVGVTGSGADQPCDLPFATTQLDFIHLRGCACNANRAGAVYGWSPHCYERPITEHRPQRTNQVVFFAVAKFAQVGKFLHCAALSLIRRKG